jgi:hypothetical protein
VCDRYFKATGYLENHFRSSHRELYEKSLTNCSFCPKKVAVPEYLIQHVNESHALTLSRRDCEGWQRCKVKIFSIF